MRKPSKDAPAREHAAYRAWVRDQLIDWDPADDRGSPDVYVPRLNGVKGLPNFPVKRDE
jgi:hypothetical protein